MLSVKSIAHISANVETIEAGMEMAAMTVERQLRRKSRTTRAAGRRPGPGALHGVDGRLDVLRLVADDPQRVPRRQPGSRALELLA